MPQTISSQSKIATKLEFEDADTIRQFVNGPCARQARFIIEEAGVFNIQSEEFDEALDALKPLDPDSSHAQVNRVVYALLHSDGPIGPKEASELASLLDDAHITTVMRMREVAYLLGIAVGRQIGGGR